MVLHDRAIAETRPALKHSNVRSTFFRGFFLFVSSQNVRFPVFNRLRETFYTANNAVLLRVMDEWRETIPYAKTYGRKCLTPVDRRDTRFRLASANKQYRLDDLVITLKRLRGFILVSTLSPITMFHDAIGLSLLIKMYA